MRRTDADLARIEAVCGVLIVSEPLSAKRHRAILDLLDVARTDLPAVVADLRELREAVGPVAAILTAAEGTVGALVHDDSTIAVTVGHLRRLAACLPKGE